jgi:hypothetical protein
LCEFDILTPCRLVNSDVSEERAAANFTVHQCVIIIITTTTIAVADFITVFFSQP